MAKQLNVSLAFTADTSKAKEEIKQLQQNLTELLSTANQSSNSLGISKEIRQANLEVAQLKVALQQASSATGALDLGQFNMSLQKSGLTISGLQKTLTSLGPIGVKAFQQLATSIMNADVPLKKTNALLQNFKTTLINTARWQLSSTMLHGFMSAIQTAYRYSQDLNESLNNIRIVTGQNADQMAQFAENANKAAKRLSTTTTSYTDASLIYYQQGLGDKEVQERTETTIKMANVSRQAAEQVSSQMTAIWNNFDDGSKSLEYYGDVITALGAKTAASSSEIATGLEKFAAVSKTVGLSYEYATSALATVVAQTRQSADTVGTAFRTIFSRLEGLKLGETLEDGVDLNKYSAALKTVGVDILDATGNLKDMDTILDETAAHWDNLTQAQKVAFAETVGGVRQYTNLIALFDNWDKMQTNLTIAQGAEGTLQSQADIYAESWEAASKRVKASAEQIYSALLNDDFFIGLNNGFAKFLDGINALIKGLGGLKGVLFTVGTLVTSLYSGEISKSIDNFIYNMQISSKKGREAILQMRNDTKNALINNTIDGSTMSGQATQESYRSQGELQEILLSKGSALTAQEQQLAQILLEQNQALHDRAIAAAESAEAEQKNSEKLIESLMRQKEITMAIRTKPGGEEKTSKEIQTTKADLKASLQLYQKQLTAIEKVRTSASQLQAVQGKGLTTISKQSQEYKELANAVNSLPKKIDLGLGGEEGAAATEKAQMAVDKLRDALSQTEVKGEDVAAALSELQNVLELTESEVMDGQALSTPFTMLEQALRDAGIDGELLDEVLARVNAQFSKTATAGAEAAEGATAAASGASHAKEEMEKLGTASMSAGQMITAVGSTFMSVGMILSSIQGLAQTWSSDASAGEKLIATLTTLGMVGLAASRIFSLQNKQMAAQVVASVMVAVTKHSESAAHVANTAAIIAEEAAAWPLLAVMLALTLAIAALIGIIYLIVQAFKAMEAASPEGQLKAAQAAAEQLNEALEQTKSKAEELKAAFDEYDSITQKLEECEKGTKEWYDAIDELNQKVLEILELYPALKGMINEAGEAAITYGPNGEMQIADWAREQVIQDSRNAVKAAQGASYLGKQNVRDKQYAVDKNKVFEQAQDWFTQNGSVMWQSDFNYDNGYGGTFGMSVSRLWERLSTSDEAIKKIASGDYEGAIKQAFLEWGVDLDKTKLYQQDLWTGEYGEVNLTDTYQYQALAEMFDANIEGFRELGKALRDNTNATQQENQIMARNALVDNTKVQGSKYTDNILQMSGIIYGSTIDQNIKNWEKRITKSGRESRDQQEKDAQAYLKIAESQGILKGKNWQYKDIDSNGNVKYSYTDDQGKTKTETIDAGIVAKTLASNETTAQLQQSAEQLVTMLAGKTQQEVDKLTTAVTGESSSLALSDITKNKQIENLSELGLSDSEVKTLLDITGKSAAELVQTYNTTLQNAYDNWDTIISKHSATTKDIINNIGKEYDNITKQTALSYANALDSFLQIGGKDATTALNTEITALMDKNKDKASDIMKIASGIDWSKGPEALYEFKNQLADANIYIDEASDSWKNLITAFDGISFINLDRDIDSIRTKLTDIAKICKDIKIGSIISDEDYKKLIALNPALKDLFAITSGGYMYTGSGNLKDIGSAAAITQLKNTKAENATYSRIAKSTKGVYWDTNGTRSEINWAQLAGGGGTDHQRQSLGAFLLQKNPNIAEQLGINDTEGLQAAFTKNAEALTDYDNLIMTTFYSKLYQVQNNFEEGLYDNKLAEEVYASTIDSVEGLSAALENGYISQDTYNKYLSILQFQAIQTAESLNELYTALMASGQHGEEMPYAVFAEALIKLGEKYSNCADEVNRYEQALLTNNSEQILAAEGALAAAIAAGEFAEQYDLSAESIERYAEELRDSGKYANATDRALVELAKDQLRYDRAVESAKKSMSSWTKALEKAEKTGHLEADTAKEMAAAYGDLLDIDGTELSAQFLKSKENLEDMQKALEGDEEAYQRLQKAAGKDIITRLHLDKDSQTAFDAALADVQSQMEGFPDLEVGANLDTGGFLQALTDMVNAAHMTAQQATDYLSSMGIDANVVEEPIESTETVGYNVIANPSTASGHGYINIPGGGGGAITAEFPQVSYTAEPVEVTKHTQANALQVTSASKSSGGGVKHSGSNAGGGGGGGGGGGKKKHFEKKQPTDAKDRYHVVKNTLEEQESQYKRIDTAYQRAFGKSKLDLLDKQIAKQKDLIKTQERYLNEAKEYLKIDKEALETTARKQVYNEETNQYTTLDTSIAGLGMSVEWNDNGGIANIDAIYQANLDRYNAEIDRINKAIDSGKMSEEEANWAKKIADALYEGTKEAIDQYEETQDFVNEKLQDYIDAQNAYYDKLLERTQLVVTLKVTVEDDAIKLIDFLLERLAADAYNAAQRIDKLGESFESSAKKMDAYKWGLIDLLANHGDENAEGTFAKLMSGEITPEQLLTQMQEGGNVFTQAEADAIREYMDNILSEATNQLEIQKKVIEEIGTVLEENNRRLDRQIGKIEHLQNVMSSYKNIIDLSGRRFLGITSEIYDAMEEANVKLANDTLEADKARMDASNAWLQKIKEDYAAVYDTLTDEAKKAYEEQIEAAEDAAQEATEAYYSSWEAAIEAINTRFESAMQHMAEDFSKTMAGVAGNLEGVQQRMDLRKMVADVYVPEYEKMYQLTKLTREAQKSIDNASNVKVKQELLRVQQKIVEAQESGAKISQYELDYLQRELDLKAAQMALEEASKAKSQVRMTRDSEGNYAYVYTANEEAVEEAEQNYADKLYEMQKLNEEYVASLQDMLVELESNYIQALQDAAETYGKGTEEYASAVADIQSQYGTYFDELMSEMGLVLSNNKETETIHAEIYKRLTGDVYQANVDLQTSWEETTLAGVTGYETLGQYQTAWAAASQKAYDDVIQANDIWMASMAEAYNLAGESIDTFAQTVGGDFEQIKEESQSLKEQMVEEDLPAMTEAINEVSESVKSWQETYAEAIKAMLEDTEKMIAKYNELLAAWSKVDQKHQAAEQQGNANDANSSTGTQTNGNNSNNNNGNTKSSSSGGGGSSGSTGNQGGYGGGSGTSALIGGNNAIRNLTMLRFASGGYTGDWAGDEGKIAVLDRKELVLNAQDTFNILKAVDMIKTISQTIDINAMSAGGAFSNLISPFVTGAGDRLEQEVHITAEFPNVTNKNEILEAFDNVINLASQYANR